MILEIWVENNIIDYACRLRYEEDKYIIKILLPIRISERIRCTLHTSVCKVQLRLCIIVRHIYKFILKCKQHYNRNVTSNMPFRQSLYSR